MASSTLAKTLLFLIDDNTIEKAHGQSSAKFALNEFQSVSLALLVPFWRLGGEGGGMYMCLCKGSSINP